MAPSFVAVEGILSGQQHDNGHFNLKSSNTDGLAPAKGILVGLASSVLFWIVVFAAWCL